MSTEDLSDLKLRAEISKINAETEVLARGWWWKLGELLKIIGAVAATAAAAYAAITTYRITQLETRLAITEKQQADAVRDAALRARDTAVKEAQTAITAKIKAELAQRVATNESRIAVAAKAKAETEAATAEAHAAAARDAQGLAQRERDEATRQLHHERAAAEYALKQRTAEEENLRQITSSLNAIRAEFALLEVKNVVELSPETIASVSEMLKPLQAHPELTRRPKILVSTPHDLTMPQIERIVDLFISAKIILVPTPPSKLTTRDVTAVRYFNAEAEEAAAQILNVLKVVGLTRAYVELASLDSALTTPFAMENVAPIEIRFGSDSAQISYNVEH